MAAVNTCLQSLRDHAVRTPRGTLALAAIGALTVARTAYSVWSFLRLNILGSGYDLKRRYAKAGSYAIVTGGSDGIGFAMSTELAKQGFNLIIIALDQPLLYEAADKLRQYGTLVQAIPFDFAQPQAEETAAYTALFQQLDAYPIAMLVNNVGMFYRYPMPYVVSPIPLDVKMMTVNMNSQMRMTKYVLPRLQAAGCGGILNLSSMSSVAAAPYLAVYAGTKGFNMMFARALQAELSLAYPKIDVLIVTPHLVVSSMTQGARAERPVPGGQMVAASEVAQQALRKMGRTRETAGHWKHCIIREVALSWLGKAAEANWVRNVDNAYKEALAMNAKA